MTQTVDIRIQGGGQVIDRLGIADAVRRSRRFQYQRYVICQSGEGSETSPIESIDPAPRFRSIGSAGLYVKGHLGEHAFGFNVSDVATGGGFVNTPLQVTTSGGQTNHSRCRWRLRGFEARQVAFSYAYAFSDKNFHSV